MTAGQRLIEQGRQQGLQEAREEARLAGNLQGILEGTQEVLLRLLRERFGDAVNAQVEQRIATAPLEQLDAWVGRLLVAATLAEVLTDSIGG
jgi:flagellar biosynthesis/type III secretory pathway protein FliH